MVFVVLVLEMEIEVYIFFSDFENFFFMLMFVNGNYY